MFFQFNMIIHYGLNFFDDEIDNIRFYNQNSQRTIEKVKEVTIIPV